MVQSFLQLPRGIKAKTVLVLALCALTMAFSVFGAAPGHLSIDEIVYHLMTRSLYTAESLDVLNGYRDFASASFVFPTTLVHDGKLVSQYPAFHSVLALPFYAAAGYRGLFVLNAAAFCGVVWLCYLTAQRIFANRSQSLTACLIFILATYAWDYAQAAWPHSLSTLFVAAAVFLALLAAQSRETTKAVLFALAGGLVVGFGVGVRVDVIFVLPALILPLLFARPVRLGPAIACGLGVLPGLAVLAIVNQAKFGIASPFSYGPRAAGSGGDPLTYLPVALLGLAAAAAVWFATRPRGQAILDQAMRGKMGVAIVGVAGTTAGALLFVPEISTLLAKVAGGFYQLIVDFRGRNPGIIEGGLSRGPGGGMVYFGALKKSLLQSLPYLVVLAIPIWALIHDPRHRLAMAMLLLVPAGYIGFYSYSAWHGGMSLNLRYFVPVLPFTSILTAYALHTLAKKAAGGALGYRLGKGLSALLLAAIMVLAPFFIMPMARTETVLLTVPLVLALVVFVLTVTSMFAKPRIEAVVAQPALAGLLVALTWSGIVAFTYDVPRAWAKRALAVEASAKLAPLIAPRSLIVVERKTLFTSLYARGDITIAEPMRDDFASFRALLASHFRARRAVYAWFSDEKWDEMRKRGLLRSIAATRLTEIGGYPFVRLRAKPLRAGASKRTEEFRR